MNARLAFLRRHAPALAVALFIVVGAVWVSGSRSAIFALVTVGVFSVIAVPFGLLYGHGGILSIAQASFAALGAYTSAILTVKFGWSPWATVLLAMIVPALVAFVLARFILRLHPIALVLATLALGRVVELSIKNGGDLTGGAVGITAIPMIPGIGIRTEAFILIWTLVLVAVLVHGNFVHSARGRALNAVRSDPTLAQSVGANATADLTIVFTIAAAFAGLAGWFYAHYLGFIAPESLSFGVSSVLLLMVIVGGRRLALGPVIGAAFYTWLQDALPSGELQNLFFGCLLALVFVFLPNGLVSLPHKILRLSKRRAKPEVSHGVTT